MEEIKTLSNYSRYAISIRGEVFNKETQLGLFGSKNPDGYVNYRLTSDDGETKTYGRHVLIARLFIGEPESSDMIVNHINGIKGDDRVNNLEWTTYQGNIEHAGAMGLTEKCHPVSTRDISTGEITHYPSAVAAARNLGLTKDAILYRLKNGEERIYPEGLQYRHRNDSLPWSDETTSKYGRNQAVLVKNIETGMVLRFDKQNDAAAFTGLNISSLSIMVKDKDQPLVGGKYLMKREEDEAEWRELAHLALELARSQGTRAVVAIENATGKEMIYSSAKACADAMYIKTTTLSERLKSNGKITFKDGHRYRYY